MAITFAKKHLPTNAKTLGVTLVTNTELSNWAIFHETFSGFKFQCRQTGKLLTRLQIYWRDPEAAITMAQTLIVPAAYTLINYTNQNPVKDVA